MRLDKQGRAQAASVSGGHWELKGGNKTPEGLWATSRRPPPAIPQRTENPVLRKRECP